MSQHDSRQKQLKEKIAVTVINERMAETMIKHKKKAKKSAMAMLREKKNDKKSRSKRKHSEITSDKAEKIHVIINENKRFKV